MQFAIFMNKACSLSVTEYTYLGYDTVDTELMIA